MARRLYFLLVTLFWVAMNVLLWRSEMGANKEAGSPVSLASVWERILTAPDDSSLQAYWQGRKLGYCRWAANVGEELATGKTAPENAELEGRVQKLTGYTVDLDGNLLVGETSQRWRVNGHAEFDSNRVWKRLNLRLILRPTVWEVRADAKAETVTLKVDDPDAPWEQRFTFAELSQPENLLANMGLPWAMGWINGLAPGMGKKGAARPAVGLTWQARSDWLQIGHSQLRAYRLQARVLDKYQIVVFVSRVGELLRIELPNEVVLINDALVSL